MVVGLGEAGKSTLIGALCERPLNLEVDGRTVAMDHGMLRHGDVALSVVGVPGQARFAAVQVALAERAMAAIWVLRAHHDPDEQTAHLLARLGLPYLLVINHHDGEPERGIRIPDPLPRPAAVLRVNLRRAAAGPEIVRLREALLALVDSGAASA